MKKQVSIRLNRSYDLDLMLFYYAPGCNFGRIVKQMLYSYAVHDTSFSMKTDGGKPTKELPLRTQAHIYLDEEDEHELTVINLLANVADRQVNSFVKNLIRFYLQGKMLSVYFNEVPAFENTTNVTGHIKKAQKPKVPKPKPPKPLQMQEINDEELSSEIAAPVRPIDMPACAQDIVDDDDDVMEKLANLVPEF